MEAIVDWAHTIPEALRWLIILALGAVPFIESFFASVIGIVAGVHPAVAIPLAIVGNISTMLLSTWLGMRAKAAASKRSTEPKPRTKRQEKVARRLERWGVPGVSILGQMFVPSQFGAGILVGLGAAPKRVVIWQTAGIVLWALVFGGLATAGVVWLR